MNINQIKLDNKFKLVEASAGTGKSFTLAHIVLRNVLEKKIKPEEILLLSFTKNTCSELRDKILLRFNKLKLFLQKQDGTERKPNFRGHEKPINDILVNENLSKLATSSTKVRPLNNGGRWITDVALSYVNNRNGNETKNSEIRVSVEQPSRELGTIGGALGVQYNNSDTVSPNSGKVENKGASFTVYNIMNVRENLFLENHLMVASGKGRAKLSPNGQIWSSKFDTDSFLYGFSLKGLIETSLLKQVPILKLNKTNLPKIILITGHRRESFGEGFQNICDAIKQISILHTLINFRRLIFKELTFNFER